jgi:hypothetical protein
MGSIFYLVGLLNALYTIMWCVFIISAGILDGIFVSKAIDGGDESWMDAKEKTVCRKAKKISSILCAISVLYVLFVPSGDTYLKMKAVDAIGEERIEDVFDLLDQKLMDAVEEAGLIEYD